MVKLEIIMKWRTRRSSVLGKSACFHTPLVHYVMVDVGYVGLWQEKLRYFTGEPWKTLFQFRGCDFKGRSKKKDVCHIRCSFVLLLQRWSSVTLDTAFLAGETFHHHQSDFFCLKEVKLQNKTGNIPKTNFYNKNNQFKIPCQGLPEHLWCTM